MMRAQADNHPGEDWLLHALADLCLDQGRPQEGLVHLDALKDRRGGEEQWDLFRIRLPLIAATAGTDAALEQARAHPEGHTPYAAEAIARTLYDAGHTEEALTVLDPANPEDHPGMAAYLIHLGRIEDAVTLLQQDNGRPFSQWGGNWCSEPPF
ncbi:hypothetical protein ACIA8O_37100 [Kitasatospora sp. NPDC051853]|uniref:hypothetical protein n=1 Tax=Kitasatospora sp. NPDC051853 TaxID=3364058 RepID=UPI0037A56954